MGRCWPLSGIWSNLADDDAARERISTCNVEQFRSFDGAHITMHLTGATGSKCCFR
jgi:hypothetical protein